MAQALGGSRHRNRVGVKEWLLRWYAPRQNGRVFGGEWRRSTINTTCDEFSAAMSASCTRRWKTAVICRAHACVLWPNRPSLLLATEDAFDNCAHVLVTVSHEDDGNAVLHRPVNHEKPLDWKTT